MKNFFFTFRHVGIPLIIFVSVASLCLVYPRFFVALVLIGAGYATIRFLDAQRRFRRDGFQVSRSGRDNIAYEELYCGGKRLLKFGGEMLVGAPQVIYLPSASTWKTAMPEWARDRRDEIIQRIKQELGSARYTYEDS